MEYRRLGSTGMYVSEISYGNWITHGSQVESEAAIKCVREALNQGITTFDTADVYANTKAEVVLAKALKGVRFETKNNCLKIFCDSILTKPIVTNDVVNLISEKRFVWKGRVDFVINSGAIKIYPEELEKKLSQAISVPFVIIGVPDEEFGEKITIVFEGETPHNFKDLIEGLDFFEKPKKVFNLDVFPRNNNKVLRRKIITKILKLYESN